MPSARVSTAASCSAIRRRYADELAPAAARRARPATHRSPWSSSCSAEGASLGSALRVARQLTLERLAVLDVEEGAPLADITRAMTELAEATLELALARARADQDARFGVPRNAAGERIDFWIVGMGKLGARELNVSSDIDLIYVYEEDGTTDGARPVSAHEYFAQVARSLYALIGEVTEDGFVFRVDLALRPNGNSGPPAVSLAMLEDYLQAHGREWERFAWLKSRVVAPRASVEERPRAGAAARWSPPSSIAAISTTASSRACASSTPRCATRRSAAPPGGRERANDVKLSRGGIREIEFIVQLLLVVRGGQFPEIRTRSTLKALDKLAAGGLMKRASAERLAAAYTLLRRVEHRIQYLDDQQTHVLPSTTAISPGSPPASAPRRGGPCALLDLPRRGARVRRRRIRPAAARRPRASAGNGCRSCGPAPLPVDAEDFLAQLPAELRGAGAAALRPAEDPHAARREQDPPRRPGRARRPGGRRGSAARLQAAIQFVDWLEPLLRRESYLALLAERPEVQNRLLRLLGLARWPMRYLMLHPGRHRRARRRASCCTAASTPRPTSASSRSATPAGSARARPRRSCCSTPCAAPTTPRCSAPWCATSRATSRSSRSPTTCRRWPTRRSPAPCAGPGST